MNIHTGGRGQVGGARTHKVSERAQFQSATGKRSLCQQKVTAQRTNTRSNVNCGLGWRRHQHTYVREHEYEHTHANTTTTTTITNYPFVIRLAEEFSDAERIELLLVDAQEVGDVPERMKATENRYEYHIKSF